jgi:hypothetical protein
MDCPTGCVRRPRWRLRAQLTWILVPPKKMLRELTSMSRPQNVPGDRLRATGRKCCAILGGGCLETPAATRPAIPLMLGGRDLAQDKTADGRKPLSHLAGGTQDTGQKMLRGGGALGARYILTKGCDATHDRRHVAERAGPRWQGVSSGGGSRSLALAALATSGAAALFVALAGWWHPSGRGSPENVARKMVLRHGMLATTHVATMGCDAWCGEENVAQALARGKGEPAASVTFGRGCGSDP